MRTNSHRIASLTISNGCKARLGFAVGLLLLALCAVGQTLHAANITYVVGTCKGNSPYKTIQSALNATPAPDTVEVCPALYPEQIIITRPVTIEGIDQGNQAQVRMVAPDNGFNINDTVDDATIQIFVDHVNGAVNLSNLVLNAQGAGGGNVPINLIGVLYRQSGGTINHVTVDYQAGQNVLGSGIKILGGSSQEPVTVENCSVHDFSLSGISISAVEGPETRATISNNVISASSAVETGIDAGRETDTTISGNTVIGTVFGILTEGANGSVVANNTVVGAQVGIAVGFDGPSVSSNNVVDSAQAGISVFFNLKDSRIENNLITSVNNPGGAGAIGIELNCNSVTSTQVYSNTIMDADYGYAAAPAGFGAGNNYVGVLFETSPCAGSIASVQTNPGAVLSEPGGERMR